MLIGMQVLSPYLGGDFGDAPGQGLEGGADLHLVVGVFGWLFKEVFDFVVVNGSHNDALGGLLVLVGLLC